MKLFCVSDIHGYFDEFKAALDAVGFDSANESHWLIGCGDYFDRGRQPLAVMEYPLGYNLRRRPFSYNSTCMLL